MRVGLFTDGLAHLERLEALRWCAERGIEDLEMGVGTWSPRPHLDLPRLLAEPAERDRLQGELREHGQRLACVNAAGNPLTPARAGRAEAQAALRGAIELAALLGVDTVVTMSGCPGGRGGNDSTGVFAVSWVCCDDEPLWEWQFREHVVPFWRELSTWAATAAPDVRICLELHPGLTIFGAESFARLRAEVGPNIGINLDPSHFWWQGVDPLADRRAARRRDRLRARQGHAAASRSHPRARAARRPLPDRPGHGLVALHRRRRQAVR